MHALRFHTCLPRYLALVIPCKTRYIFVLFCAHNKSVICVSEAAEQRLDLGGGCNDVDDVVAVAI